MVPTMTRRGVAENLGYGAWLPRAIASADGAVLIPLSG